MADGLRTAVEPADTLYERDFFAWTQVQAAALRAVAGGHDEHLDLLNLAEEIESVGLRDAREVWSRMGTIIEHLLKLDVSAAQEPRSGWRSTVRRTRGDLQRLLEQSPSLRRHVRDRLAQEHELAAREVVAALREHGEDPAPVRARLDAGGYTEEQVLGEWWPEPPPPVA